MAFTKFRRSFRSCSALLLATSVIGCSQHAPSGPPTEARVTPRDFVVVIDLSASRTPAMETDAEAFLRGMTQQLTFGDKLTLLQMQQSGVADHPLRQSTEIPAPRDSTYISARDKRNLAGAQSGVDASLPTFFRQPPGSRILHTDILATLHIAAEAAADANGRPVTLLLLSDMLQSADGIEMEGAKHLPAPDWLARQQQQGLIPSLSGTCVVVVGADATTASGAAVRRFWERYFAAAGTELKPSNYRITPPSLQRDLCR